ncbi:MAG: polysulfide reductase NrfD [Proteobacteria bacterium]|nr:polysulfide reductase NrfD [Pseudomonadota bacterium]MBU4356849.1 polysulfide reductase NrfD [Pseudomonadota bacterium]MBU4447603.1 polysulfide reductase NrfD [Pseudomonadota bacterium]MCG2773402.1 polysulfide reductase NrfD [Desulfobacterales bacterium]
MSEKVEKWYPGEGKLTTGRAILYVILVLGLISAVIRLFFGLGSTTNLSDAYPWGLWISFDILSGVALAGGGFTMAAAIYIFNLKKFEPLLRPAKFSAFIGYLVFVIGLFFDLGQPWRIWHPMVMWNPQSVLFEVSWCVMLYTTVLGVDIFIMALERWKKYDLVAFFRNIYLVLVVAGVMLSTLHQSSLGALYLLMPEKMSDLWASQAIGPLFFCSAVIGGMGVVTLESFISSWAYKRKPELKLLSSLGKGLGIVLLVYFAMKVTDLYARGATVWTLDKAHFFFYLELFGTVALPAILLTFSEVRNSIKGLYWAAGLSAFGVVLNRFNVSLTSYGGYRDFSYFPSAIEIIITLALIAGGILIFDWGTRYLPVYHSELSGKTS